MRKLTYSEYLLHIVDSCSLSLISLIGWNMCCWVTLWVCHWAGMYCYDCKTIRTWCSDCHVDIRCRVKLSDARRWADDEPHTFYQRSRVIAPPTDWKVTDSLPLYRRLLKFLLLWCEKERRAYGIRMTQRWENYDLWTIPKCKRWKTGDDLLSLVVNKSASIQDT